MIKAVVPLGEQAALLYFNDEAAAGRFMVALRRANEAWVVDAVQAYTSVAVFFDLDRIRFAQVAERLRSIEQQPPGHDGPEDARLHNIPCCYEFEQDLALVATHTGLPPDEIVRLHAETEYTVYAIGFCPGFPYLGYLPSALCGVPRLQAPRLRVEAGSVGLTGRQTGIYTEARPGGWNIVGRTPLELVSVLDGYFPLRTGDRVRFHAIDKAEYQKLLGRRLEPSVGPSVGQDSNPDTASPSGLES
jgi:inhibitor of KinA